MSDRAATVAAIKRAAELQSTVRLYVKEFVFDSRHVTEAEAQHAADAKYLGRLVEEDFDVRHDSMRAKPWEVWARRWNLVGEYKNPEQADEKAASIEDETKVVPRNSRAEHELKAYGVTKLPT